MEWYIAVMLISSVLTTIYIIQEIAKLLIKIIKWLSTLKNR